MADQDEILPTRVIRTTSPDWLSQLAAVYKAKQPITLIDDAQIGINPEEHTLLEMGKKSKLTVQEWVGVVIALGVSALGAWLVVMAVIDPEPWSKVGFAIGAGVVMTMGGGYAAIRILTGHKPPNVKVAATGTFEIRWE